MGSRSVLRRTEKQLLVDGIVIVRWSLDRMAVAQMVLLGVGLFLCEFVSRNLNQKI